MSNKTVFYFRHAFNARNNIKIKKFMSMFPRKGAVGYAYYFMLIEVCASANVITECVHTVYTFHTSTLRGLWGTNTKGVQSILHKMVKSALISGKVVEEECILTIANMPNFLGSYGTKERKGKEIKGNKRKEKEKKGNNNNNKQLFVDVAVEKLKNSFTDSKAVSSNKMEEVIRFKDNVFEASEKFLLNLQDNYPSLNVRKEWDSFSRKNSSIPDAIKNPERYFIGILEGKQKELSNEM